MELALSERIAAKGHRNKACCFAVLSLTRVASDDTERHNFTDGVSL